jgi:hypothetical protein
MANNDLFERARVALLSRAVQVPTIEQRKRAVKAACKAAQREEFLLDPMANVSVATMIRHCARREARHKARQKI